MYIERPLVSWLIPVYNAGKYICRALDSMLLQTYQHFEIIIIVENNCEDDTLKHCLDYATSDKRIRIFLNQEHFGVAKSLNRGLELCNGKYIARMDADDFCYPERLEKQVTFMEANLDVGILGTWSRFINAGYERYDKNYLDSERLRIETLFMNPLIHSTVMFRAESFQQNNWRYPECEAEDFALYAMLISKAKMACIPDVLLDRHFHSSNASKIKPIIIQQTGVNISKKAIFEELNIDTSRYPDDVFIRYHYPGMRLPYDLKQHLIDIAQLLRQMTLANALLNKFNNKVFIEELHRQWEYTKNIVYMKDLLISLTFTELDTDNISKSLNRLFSHPRVIVYGTGKYCQEIFEKVNCLFNIIVFCDSDPNKKGASFYDKEIISPKQLSEYGYDYIFIASAIYESDIRNSLISDYNILPGKIFGLNDLMIHYNRINS